MAHVESPQLRLQQQIDCQLEVNPKQALKQWEKDNWQETPGTDVDEAPLKYLALVLSDAIEEKAVRLSIDKDEGVMVFADPPYALPKAPSHYIARGLEILREITGLEQAAAGEGKLALGIRNDSLDLVVQKQGGKHIINILGF